MSEPRLSEEDKTRWERWRRGCLAHAQTHSHSHRVEAAKAAIEAMYKRCPDAYVAWSGGKDSTAMTHLCSTLGFVHAMSIKDDLDFPGEEEYLREYADAWGINIDILHPPFSLQDWIRTADIEPAEDLHSRSSAFSQAAFYGLIDQYRERLGCPGVYLGLRAEESSGRRENRRFRGLMYRKVSGEVVCQPLADWTTLDVFAYLFAHDIEPLPVYRCIGFTDDPGRIRKSWWIGGAASADGSVAWLRRYWPSLFAKLSEILPSSRAYS